MLLAIKYFFKGLLFLFLSVVSFTTLFFLLSRLSVVWITVLLIAMFSGLCGYYLYLKDSIKQK